MQDSVNWGVIVPDAPPGQPAKAKAAVTMRNTGTELLVISEVRPGCGCTTAPIDNDSLQPGEETVMNVTLNLPLANGPIEKIVTVRCNDSEQPARILYLSADVQRPLQLSSSFIPFDKGKVGEPIRGIMTFNVQGTEPIAVTAHSEQTGVKIVSPMPFIIEPGTSGGLEISYTTKNVGPFTVKVHFTTDQNGYEKFDLSGYGVADPAD